MVWSSVVSYISELVTFLTIPMVLGWDIYKFLTLKIAFNFNFSGEHFVTKVNLPFEILQILIFVISYRYYLFIKNNHLSEGSIFKIFGMENPFLQRTAQTKSKITK